MTDNEKTRTPPSPDDAPSGASPPIDSSTLFTGRSEVLIRHEGQVYRLRATKNGKLVMNK